MLILKSAKTAALIALSSLFFAACGYSPQEGQGDTRPQTQGSLPLRLVFAEDAPAVWGDANSRLDIVAALKQAADIWNQAAGVKLIQFDGTRAPVGSALFARDETSRDGRNTVYIFEDFGDTRATLGADSPTDILGLCVTRGFESDIALTLMAKLRRQSGGESAVKEVFAMDLAENRFSSNAFDFMSVAVHEFGHALGLAHDLSDEQSVMWEKGLAVGRINRGLSASDKQQLGRVLAKRYGLTLDIPATSDPDPVRN